MNCRIKINSRVIFSTTNRLNLRKFNKIRKKLKKETIHSFEFENISFAITQLNDFFNLD